MGDTVHGWPAMLARPGWPPGVPTVLGRLRGLRCPVAGPPCPGNPGRGSHLSDTGGLQGAPQSSPSGFWSWFSGSQTNRESVSCVDAGWLLCQPLGTDGKGFETEPGEL